MLTKFCVLVGAEGTWRCMLSAEVGIFGCISASESRWLEQCMIFGIMKKTGMLTLQAP